MGTRQHTAAAVLLATLVPLASGCGGDKPKTLEIEPGSAKSSSTADAGEEFVMLEDGDTVGAGVTDPPEARPDATGATEFAVWYLDVFEHAPKPPGPETISEVAADCQVCMDGVRDWDKLAKQRVSSGFAGPVTFRGPVSKPRDLGEGRTAVSLLVDEPKYQLMRNGKVIKSYAGAKNRQFTFTLVWKDQQWHVVDQARLDPGAS